MSAPIVAHATVKTKPDSPRGAQPEHGARPEHGAQPERTAELKRSAEPTLGTQLERGSFADSVRTYTVRASSTTAPDSFQVHTGSARDIVLVISGLNTGELHATWGPGWRTASDIWREWFEAKAFMVFYNGDQTATGRVRVCNG